MQVRPASRFTIPGAGLLLIVGALFGWAAFSAGLQGDSLPTMLFAFLSVAVLLMAYSIWSARLIADESLVRRTRPWPRTCRRSDLRLIRAGGPSLSAGWSFVLSDGRVAFTVSSYMFPADRIQPFADYLHVAVDNSAAPRAEN
jgi:hypothetical protein